MLSLLQARRLRGAAGEPLPQVYQAFEEYEIVFRRSMFALVVAGPGVGKSTLALNLALLMRVPTMYFSADSNAFTQVSRSFQISEGVTKDRADAYALGGDDDLADRSFRSRPVRWSFSAAPTEDDIQNGLESFAALYGGYPWLTIVDNISNVMVGESDRSSASMDSLTDFLNDTARQTQSCVIGLHHANGPYSNGDQPIPRNQIKDQPHRVPQLILTLFRPDEGVIGVSKVKDRDGPYDPTGQWYARLAFDTVTMRVTDLAA